MFSVDFDLLSWPCSCHEWCQMGFLAFHHSHLTKIADLVRLPKYTADVKFYFCMGQSNMYRTQSDTHSPLLAVNPSMCIGLSMSLSHFTLPQGLGVVGKGCEALIFCSWLCCVVKRRAVLPHLFQCFTYCLLITEGGGSWIWGLRILLLYYSICCWVFSILCWLIVNRLEAHIWGTSGWDINIKKEWMSYPGPAC